MLRLPPSKESQHSPAMPPPCTLQFSLSGGNHQVSVVGAHVAAPATVTAYVPAKGGSFMLLNSMLLPAGVKAVPLPPPPPRSPPPPRAKKPPGKTVGGAGASTFYYQGCYADGQISGVHTLPTLLYNNVPNLNASMCAVAAASQNLGYFGMQGGGTCYGGTSLTMATVRRWWGRVGQPVPSCSQWSIANVRLKALHG